MTRVIGLVVAVMAVVGGVALALRPQPATIHAGSVKVEVSCAAPISSAFDATDRPPLPAASTVDDLRAGAEGACAQQSRPRLALAVVLIVAGVVVGVMGTVLDRRRRAEVPASGSSPVPPSA